MAKRPRTTNMIKSRQKLGERQKAKSRDAIVEAAGRVLERKTPESAVIDDFVSEAGVSRGTFYNHFDGVVSLFAEVALRLRQQLNDEIRVVYKDKLDAAERISIAIRHVIGRATKDRQLGWLIVRIAMEDRYGTIIRQAIAPDLEAGHASGRIPAIEFEVAVDIVMGITEAAIRSVLEGRSSPGHPESIAAAILRALGLTAADAAEVVSRSLPPLGSGLIDHNQ